MNTTALATQMRTIPPLPAGLGAGDRPMARECTTTGGTPARPALRGRLLEEGRRGLGGEGVAAARQQQKLLLLVS
jgi:hypothetical protein